MTAFAWPFRELAVLDRVRVLDHGGQWHGHVGRIVGCAPGPGGELGDGPVVCVELGSGPILWALPELLERIA